MAKIDEPLLESAPLAWRMAPQLCRKNPATGEDCAPMHGAWQYLRVLGLVGSIQHRADFYLSALDGVMGAGREHPRVLICGAADYTMLAYVLTAFRERGIEPDVTVLDRCETSLMLNRWYAERGRRVIETLHNDILEYTPAVPYDAICTDSFLGLCPLARREALVEKWRELLRPGGLVITGNRLRPGNTADQIGFSAEQAQALRAAVMKTAGEMREMLEVSPDELAQLAYLYATKQVTYAVRSLEDIRQLFESAGFSMSHLSAATITTEGPHGVGGPSIRANAQYAKVVASRL